MTARMEIASAEILLVEDNPVDILITKRVLKDQYGWRRMHVTTDGEEALDFLYRRNQYADAPEPDLILLDLNLPKKSGMEVLGQIKQDAQLCRIPVVILTTSSANKDIAKSYELHANCFVTKPSDYSEFEKTAKLIDEFWLNLAQLPSRNHEATI